MKPRKEPIKFAGKELPWPLAVAFLLSVLYNVVFFMQFSATPYVVKALGISDADYGRFLLHNIFQDISRPSLGFYK